MPDWLLVLTLIILGYVLLAIEVLVIPGFGMIGVSGFVSLILACYFAYTKLNLLLGLIISFGSFVIIILSWKLLPKTGIWKKLRLDNQETREAGFNPFERNLGELIGKEGVTLSPLRPIGVCLIEEKRVDAISEGGVFIDRDTRVIATKAEGSSLIVKQVS
jgi:membrane-bound serine protease (ClpP class)